MSPRGPWGLNLCAKHVLPKTNKHRKQQMQFNLSELFFASLRFESPTITTFMAGLQCFKGHGGLRGGCRAIVMKLMAKQVAATVLLAAASHLDSFRGRWTLLSKNHHWRQSMTSRTCSRASPQSTGKGFDLTALLLQAAENLSVISVGDIAVPSAVSADARPPGSCSS
jgi:hypothetical protein